MSEKITTAVIAAAGSGTRMWPASKVIPKELFALGRIPVIAHNVWELIDAGIEELIIVAAPHNRVFMADLFDPSRTPPAKLLHDPIALRFQEMLSKCSISIIEQNGNSGNGTPLRVAMEAFGFRSCVYAFGDDIVVGENATKAMTRLYEQTGNVVLAAQEGLPAQKPSFGIVEFERRDGIDYVTRILEKPAVEDTASNLASFGRYLMTEPALAMLAGIQPGRDEEIWFIDAVAAHLKRGAEVCVCRLIDGAWYTVGDLKGYAAAVFAATDEQLRLSAECSHSFRWLNDLHEI